MVNDMDTNIQSDYICNDCKVYEKQLEQLQSENERLKGSLNLSIRAVERLSPKNMLGLIILENGDIYNHIESKQLIGMDLAKREQALKDE